MAYWDFLQMTPENQVAARNTSWGSALKSEIPGTSNYRGYNPFYKGADRVGLGSYANQGVRSLAGNFQRGSNVGGATTLMRKLAMSPVARGIGTVGRVAGLTNPVGAAATAAYFTPKLIDKLTARDADATQSSLFGIDLTQNANEQAALPDSSLADWGSSMGVIPGEEIQEQVTEETAPHVFDPGVEHSGIPQEEKTGFFEGIGQKLGMTQVSDADRAANEAYMGGVNTWSQGTGPLDQGTGLQIGRDPTTGRMIGGDFAGKNAPGTSGWGSANFGEMAQKWDEKYGDMVYKTQKMRDKQARIKKEAADYQAKLIADKSATDAGDKTNTGGKPTTYGGPPASFFDPKQSHNAPTHIGQGPLHGVQQGGYMRSRYNQGGRVGILSVF